MRGAVRAEARSLDAWLGDLETRHAVDPDLREIDLGLERISRVWQRLGAPPLARRVVTVAGTNGKGSTVLALEALARAQGMRVCSTLSPHLERFNERIRLDGVEASDAVIVNAFERIECARLGNGEDAIALTYFEFAILAALLLIAARAPDLAILEVGLGGRLDAVNIIDCDIAVITPVDLDHQAWLGADRERIGAEKAGILRPARPVVITDPDPPASVIDRARVLQAPCLRLGVDFEQDPAAGPAAQRVHPAALAGALAVLRLLDAEPGPEVVARALADLVIPGRMQRIRGPGVEMILDVAHNPHAAAALAQRLPAPGRWQLVFGAMADKDVEAMFALLAPRLDRVHLVDTPGSRGTAASALAERLTPLAANKQLELAVAGPVTTGLDQALAGTDTCPRILVCGSFTVVGAAIAHLRKRGMTP